MHLSLLAGLWHPPLALPLALGAAGAGGGHLVERACRLGRYRRCGDQPRGRPRFLPAWLGVTWLLLGQRLADTPAYLVAVVLLSLPLLALAAVDVDVHRLPDALTLPLYPAAGGSLAVSALVDGQPEALRWSVTGGLGGLALFLVLALTAPPGGLGLGDVKLVGILGLIVGPCGPAALLLAVWAGFAIAGLVGVVALTRGAAASTSIAFGPALIIGAAAAVIVVGR